MKKEYNLISIISAFARSFFVLGLFLIVPSVISFIFKLIIKDDVSYNQASVPIMMASYVVVILIFTALYKIIGFRLFDVVGLKMIKPSICISSAFLGIGAYGIIQALIVLLSFVLPKSWVGLQNEHSSALLGGSMVVAIIYTVLIAPLCEELVFRGLITCALYDNVPKILTILVPAVLFSLIHLPSPIALLYTLILGLVLGFIRLRTNSLVPCVLIHSFFNLTNYMLFIPNQIGLYIVWGISLPLVIIAIINIIKQTRNKGL